MENKEKLNYGNGFNDTNSIVVIWAIEDVRCVIDDNDWNLKLTDDECMEVLTCVERNHDANWGVGWESLTCIIEDWWADEIREGQKEVANAN